MSKIKRMFFVVSLCLTEILLVFSFSPSLAHAAVKSPVGTHVSGDITTDTTWDLQGSPYIFDWDVNVLANVTLRVMPGVKISMASGIGPMSLVVYGTLDIVGTLDKPVDITGIDRIYSDGYYGGSVSIAYARLHDGPNVVLLKSKVVIASSTISNADSSAFYVQGSSVDGWNLRIENSSVDAIYVSLGNGLGVLSSISIHDSSFIGNPIAVNNKSGVLLHLENNWWGNSSGPTFSGSNSVQGSVVYSPWLTSDPNEGFFPKVCCSSILFIPGLEGTRMHSGTNQLWEPNRNADVQKLYLDSLGSSTDRTIYSTGPIDKAFGLKPIYGKFMGFLQDLSDSGSVNEAKTFGYDWRKPISQVVLESEKKATTTESLLATVAEMASNSKTGKVTLIAHSNGGLVAKYLVKILTDLGKSNLIDKVISVAVPYLGTPEAILGLLHGDNQSILGGLILSQATVRGLGENMSSAYSLLPSVKYFSKIFTPTIAFASTTVYGLNNGSYPQMVSDVSGQMDFIDDVNGVRTKPAFGDTRSPIIGNRGLSIAADALHSIIDVFTWPANIANWTIVGWNRLTTLSVNYADSYECGLNGFNFLVKICRTVISHTASTTIMGDGTVISPSATFNGGIVASLDLAEVSKQENSEFDHTNILEASSAQTTIRQIVENNNTSGPISLPKGVALGEPDYSKENSSSLVLSTHSPVELHIYDSRGNHTGLISKPPELAQNDFVTGAYETKIPGSSFRVSSGENSDSDTYIRLPYGDGQNYSVVINGTDFGFFTFQAERFDGEKSLEKVTYSTQPIAPVSVATTTIVGSAISGPSGTSVSLVSMIPQLNVDIDANGLVDYQALPGGTGLPGNATSLEDANIVALSISNDVIKKTMKTVLLNEFDSPRIKGIIKKLDHITDLAKKGKLKQSEKQGDRLIKRLGHIKLKGISPDERKRFVDAVEAMVDAVVVQ
ncbi:MAG: hypothetical protein NT077_00630 [Candidatus Taylorbacteria bacterium]|nr:hypothetical protein [Candidatus Taylorbacteria bacterium]